MTDFKFAIRQLLKNPGFTFVAVLTLALGIGANTVIFSAVNGVILKPLPFDHPEQLVKVLEANPKRDVTVFPASIPNYLDWKERSKSWQSLAAVVSRSVNLNGGDRPENLRVDYVTANYLPMLGVRTILGRTFLPAEDEPGQNDVVMLTSRLWQRQFGGDPDIIGKSAMLNGRKHVIVGVTAPGDKLDAAGECFVPLAADSVHAERSQHELEVYGRLKPRVTIGQADAELKAIAQRIGRENPDSDQGWSVRLLPLARAVVGDSSRRTLFILWGVVGLLLLIACANISNLLIVRASTRTREIAVRAALGCGRLRIVRQLLTESVLLSVLGAAVGIVLAQWGVDALRHVSPEQLPRVEEIALDQWVLLYTIFATLLTGVLAGLAPVLQANRIDVQHALKESGSGMQSGRHFLRSGLVVVQLALSLVLLTGAGLLLHSLQQLRNVDLGFNPADVLTLNLAPVENQPTFYNELITRVTALPGVKSAGLVNGAPMSSLNTSLNVFPVGPASIGTDQSIQCDWRIVTGGYFDALQLPLIAGRNFISSDGGDNAKVVIINRTLAHMLWGDEDPVGKQINPGGGTSYSTVVGVVGDMRNHNPGAAPAATFYWPARTWFWGWMTLVVRTTDQAPATVPDLRAAIKSIDPDLPVFRVATMDELVKDSLATPRIESLLLGGFAATALLLAALGVYGVMACSVAQRTREIGLRMALGAQVHDVVGMIMKQGGKLILTSLLIGLVLGAGFAHVLESQLFGIKASDPWSFGLAAIALAVAALTACYLPAGRAAKVDPMETLRNE